MEHKTTISEIFFLLGFFVLLFFVLSVGATIIIPFLIALLFSFAIIGMSDFFKRIHIKNHSLPAFFSMTFSLLMVGGIFRGIVTMLSANIYEIIDLIPFYQQRLSLLSDSLFDTFHVSKELDIYQMISSLDMNTFFTALITNITSIFSQVGLISVYVLFILLEYRFFSEKIKMMFSDDVNKFHALLTLDKIKSDIRSYFLIKTIVSLITGVLSYGVMILFDLDFTLFWAMLTFLLNFIPTIGSMIAVFFPVILSLIQYDSYYPFFFILTSLVSIHIVMGNIIEPRYMGNKLNLSPLVILLSLGFWGALWGIIGMLLCVPIMVIINIILSKFPKTRPIAIMLSEKGELTVQEFQSSHPSKSELVSDVRKKIEIISKMNR